MAVVKTNPVTSQFFWNNTATLFLYKFRSIYHPFHERTESKDVSKARSYWFLWFSFGLFLFSLVCAVVGVVVVVIGVVGGGVGIVVVFLVFSSSYSCSC
jgi:hypothetical protein